MSINSMEIFNQSGSRFVGLEKFCDGSVRTEDGCEFRVHRIALASQSDYFAIIFGEQINGGQHCETFVRGISGQTFISLLNFVYKGNAGENSHNIVELLVAADYLSMKRLLRDICASVAKLLSPENCFQLLHVSTVLGHLNLYDVCFRYVQTHFSLALSQPESTGYLQELDLLTLQRLLDTNLNVDSESIVWDAIVHWISKDPVERFKSTAVLLSRIRLADVSQNLLRRIAHHPYVVQSQSCQSILQMVSGTVHLQQMLGLDPRQPPVRYCRLETKDRGTRIDLSFDDRLDIKDVFWMKMGHNDDFFACEAVAIGATIYLFNWNYSDWFCGFDLIQKSWFELPPFVESERTKFCVVALDNFVYCIGGRDVDTFDVERLYHGSNAWAVDVSNMIVKSCCKATANGGLIYCLGVLSLEDDEDGMEEDEEQVHGNDSMMFQRYDPVNNSWISLTSPRAHRGSTFSMIAFDGSLFTFGGLQFTSYSHARTAERYLVGLDIWITIKDLPGNYFSPTGLVLNGNIIVYDFHKENMPVLKWTEGTGEWQEVALLGDLRSCMMIPISDTATNNEIRTLMTHGL